MTHYSSTSRWDHARRAEGDGRAHAETFFNDGGEIGELANRVGGHEGCTGECLADLLGDSIHHVRILQQASHHAGQGRADRLTARDDEEAERALDFRQTHALFVVVAEDVGHEVVALRVGAFGPVHVPPSDLLVGGAGVDAAFCLGALGEQHLDGRFEAEVAHGEDLDGHLELIEHDRDPLVIIGRLEAVEGLPKGEVADDIKGGKVDPFGNVDHVGVGRRGPVAQSVDQEVDVDLGQVLLLPKHFIREGMRKQTSVASVIGIVGTDDGIDAVLIRSRLERVLLEVGSASPMMTVYVLPGLSVDEGKFIRGHADNRAVTVMKFLDASGHVPLPKNPDPKDP